MDDEQTKALVALVEDALGKLGEHFDAVQILCSRVEEKRQGTSSVFRGIGNWYARQGMAHDFIARDVAETNGREIAEKIKPPSEEE